VRSGRIGKSKASMRQSRQGHSLTVEGNKKLPTIIITNEEAEACEERWIAKHAARFTEFYKRIMSTSSTIVIYLP